MSFPWEECPIDSFTFDAPPPPPRDPAADPGYSPEEAGLELYDYLIALRIRGKLAAIDICIIVHFAKAAGATGAVTTLAKPPTSPTGHFSRHIDRIHGALPRQAHDWFYLDVPLFKRLDGCRTLTKVAALPPHEEIAAEICSCSDQVLAKLEAAKAMGELPARYYSHPTVVSNPATPVFPLALYVDGIKFARHDGIVGWFVYNCITQKRHCVVGLRKSSLCKCGGRSKLCIAVDIQHWTLSGSSCKAGDKHELDNHSGGRQLYS